MAKIYLSSTYTDLKACREAVYHVLRQMRHDVIAMEDYVATDQRPKEKCLADVAASDLYIGIFAWRYGYIPSEMNPEHKSITELEYRKATQEGKTCLLFMLAQDAPWPPIAMDAVTGEGNRGELITALRDEFVREKMVQFFQTPEELASSVSTAVSNWEKSRSPARPSITSPFLDTEQQEGVQREERLKALIIDHSGFIQSRLESFVGREQELAALRKEISTLLPTGGYLTITGQAGQGKSSIIARLVQEYHPKKVAHHFIPFNPGPDYQVILLRDLMAQLILKHQFSDYYVDRESRPALRVFFTKVLAEIASKGKHEVIFIDGLDQLMEDLSGERDLSFLPNNPPEGIVFVLGTRPNETLHPLELHKPHRPYNLRAITRHDFDLILQHRRVTLEQRLADRFYKAMGENALYLDLVAKELSQNVTAKLEEIIELVADNPDNIFTLSLSRLKRHAVEWREVLKPLLGVLLVAQEPLIGYQLRAILSLDDEGLREGLARLGGLIADDGRNRFTLFHLKFYDYLRQDESKPHKEYIFARDEEEDWHNKLAQWCERDGLSIIWKDSIRNPAEQGRREYARKYYITHLFFAQAWPRLFNVLDTVQYGQEKVRYSTLSYAQDLDFGRQAAAWGGWEMDAGIAQLPRLWRYTLLLCSLTSRADNYTSEAFEALLMLGRAGEAIGLAELLSEPTFRASVLLQIGKHLRIEPTQKRESLQLLQRSYEIVQSLGKSEDRLHLLRELSKELTKARQWEQAKEVIQTIEEDWTKAEALRELGIALVQAQQWEQAKVVWSETELAACSLSESADRELALRELGIALAQAQQWEQAKEVIQIIEEKEARTKALRELCTALIQAQQWDRAKEVIQTIEEDWAKAQALRELGIALAQAQQWEQAKEVIQTIEEKEARTKALRELCTALIQAQQWDQADALIRTIEEGRTKAEALCELATALAQAQQWEQAKEVIQIIEEDWAKAQALHELATALAQAQQWEQAKAVAGSLEEREDRAKALCELATALAQARRWKQAEAVAGSLEEREDRAKALCELGIALAQAQQWDRAGMVWDDVLKLTHTIKDREDRAKALCELGIALTQAQQWEQANAVWAEAERAAQSFESDLAKAEALRELATALAQAQQWERAELVVRSLKERQDRARALHDIGTELAHTQQWDRARAVWIEAELIARSLEESGDLTKVLSTISTALTQAQQWEQAKEVIQTIEEKEARTKALRELCTALIQAQQWDQADALIRTIEEGRTKAEALCELATALAQAQQWDRAKEVIQIIEEDWAKTQALHELATALAQAQQWDRAYAVIQIIEEDWTKAKALRELSTAMAQAQQWEQAKDLIVIQTIEEREARTKALRELCTVLIQAQQWDRAYAVIQIIEEDWTKAEALCELATALAQAQQWEQAKEVIQTIEEDLAKAEALHELATALTQAQQWEQADAIWAETEQVVWSVLEGQNREKLPYELGTALSQAQRWDLAEVVARSIDERKDRTLRLYKLVKALTQAKQWDRADTLWVEGLLLTYKIKGSEDAVPIQHKINYEVAAQSAEYEILCELAMVLVHAQQWQQIEKVLAEIIYLNSTMKRSNTNIEALQNLTNALSSFGKNDYVLRLVQHSWLKADTRMYAIKLLPLAIGLIPLKPEIAMAFCETFTWVEAFLKG